MKIYWCDREGNRAPDHCTFKWLPFSSSLHATALKKGFHPNREEWIRGVEKALELIHRKELQKVVLARICTLELKSAPDPFAITDALQKKAEGAFVFCLQSEQNAFLGASPERLFSRKGRSIQTEAIAGTHPRGKTPAEDQQLQQELLNSKKENLEFSFVRDYIQETLTPFCVAPLSFGPVSIHKTTHVQHLYSKCSGILKASVTDEEILAHLHPTPALCGTPKQKAFSLIRELEPFERGLYGGIIGWSTPEESEWIVGIRSCLLQGKTATLFSGTGIVEGSDPEKEWEELNQKLKLYDGILDY